MDICLALGGGGIKGVAHLGVLESLEKAGFTIRAIAGTSAGGLVGAVYAAGYSPREVLEIVESLNKSRIYARQPGDGPSLLGYTGLAEALVEILHDCTFADLKIPFACTAVDLPTAREVYLDEGLVMDAILATMAIPGIFPPKVRGDLELIDGAVLDPVPVALARRIAPGLPVVAVALNPPLDELAEASRKASAAPIPLPIPAQIVDGFARMRVGQALRIFLRANDISACTLTELRLKTERPDCIIRPEVAQYGMLDLAVPRELFLAGSLAAERAMPGVRKMFSWPERMMRGVRGALKV